MDGTLPVAACLGRFARTRTSCNAAHRVQSSRPQVLMTAMTWHSRTLSSLLDRLFMTREFFSLVLSSSMPHHVFYTSRFIIFWSITTTFTFSSQQVYFWDFLTVRAEPRDAPTMHTCITS